MQCLSMHKLCTILVYNKSWQSQYLLKITPFPKYSGLVTVWSSYIGNKSLDKARMQEEKNNID